MNLPPEGLGWGAGVIGIAAVLLGYLIGAIPFAYLITRLVSGKDIRRLGTGHTGRGNVGARNVYANVNKFAGVAVFRLDGANGAGAVALALWVLEVHPLFVLASGMAAVAGHIWPVYLRFVGGGGLATVVGVLSVLMLQEVATALPLFLVLAVATRNVVLSAVCGLAAIPLLLWYRGHVWWVVLYPTALYAVMLTHFLPNVVAEIRDAGDFKGLLRRLLRMEKRKAKAGPRRR
jgi:glycerol-3-phosphate acyltransferase PlsY